MKIEKLPSGSYRIRQQADGKRISITLPYKPTKKEAAQLISEKRTGTDKQKMTFDAAAKAYIEGKRNTLSPSTIRGYESLRKNIPDTIADKRLGEITAWDVQKYVNDISPDHAPKTVKNAHNFISAVLTTFRPGMELHTNLPQAKKREVYIPTDAEVKKIFDFVKDTEYEIPFRLATYGLRRSEICALTPDDLEGNTLTINKALVLNENKEWVVKTTKTVQSTRTIMIDSALSAAIRSQNRIYDGYPNTLYTALQKCLKSLNIRSFSFHTLRHYYASTAHAMGMPDAVIMASGGWKTDHIMKNVYRHEKEDQVSEMQKKYAEQFEKSGHIWS